MTPEIEKEFKEKFVPGLYGHSFADQYIVGEVLEFIAQKLEEAYQAGEKKGREQIMRLANELTETPNRAVRYTPLDKLFAAYAGEEEVCPLKGRMAQCAAGERCIHKDFSPPPAKSPGV